MIRDTSGDSYEAARSLDQHLTFNKAVDFFSKRKVEFGRTQMRSLHLIGEDGMYTNLAFLLSEQCTHMIRLAVFEGSKKGPTWNTMMKEWIKNALIYWNALNEFHGLFYIFVIK